ncbi:MAG TPA: type 4a pilus biogenesis protein PilO [Nitrospirota bacterium]|nr:type 4a pilus biogenesis protein PilO [Nitrospirota bacterium]
MMISLPLDKLQKISPKTRLISFGVLIVVIVVVYIIQFQIPMNTKIKELNNSLAALNTKIQENDAKIKKLDELKAEVKNLQARLVVLTEQLPPGSEVSGLLRQIQNLVNKSGLVLKSWKPDKPRTHSSGLYEEIPVSLALTGGYHNTALLFDRIGKLTRIVNISNIRMGGAKIGKSGNVEMDIACTAMTFAAVEKKSEPAPQTAKKVQ